MVILLTHALITRSISIGSWCSRFNNSFVSRSSEAAAQPVKSAGRDGNITGGGVFLFLPPVGWRGSAAEISLLAYHSNQKFLNAVPQQSEICVKFSVFHTVFDVNFW